MARSRKKTPKGGVTAAVSDQPSKREANRKHRQHTKRVLAAEGDPDVLPDRRELSDVWHMSKEGKQRYDLKPRPKDMRK